MVTAMKKVATVSIKCLIVTLLVSGLSLFWSSSGLASYGIDGNLSDWGIDPFFDWTPWDSRVDYVEEDWTRLPHYSGYIGHGDRPIGGESYDLEAMYFDDDPEFIYFAMVSSFPFSGRGGIVAGDIAIGFGGLGNYQFGMKVKGLSQYGHGFVPLIELEEGESWTHCRNSEAGPIYLEDGVGQDIGLAEIYYWNATHAGGPYNEPGTSTHTWVIEARMSRLLFDGLAANEGDTIRFHHSMFCGNDYIDLTGDFDSPIVPEPTSLLLLGSSLVALAGAKMNRRKRG